MSPQVGIFMADMHPNHHHIEEGTYALLGAASMLGGAMRISVCTCVMLLELTNNLALLPLIMLVLLVAKVCVALVAQASSKWWKQAAQEVCFAATAADHAGNAG